MNVPYHPPPDGFHYSSSSGYTNSPNLNSNSNSWPSSPQPERPIHTIYMMCDHSERPVGIYAAILGALVTIDLIILIVGLVFFIRRRCRRRRRLMLENTPDDNIYPTSFRSGSRKHVGERLREVCGKKEETVTREVSPVAEVQIPPSLEPLIPPEGPSTMA